MNTSEARRRMAEREAARAAGELVPVTGTRNKTMVSSLSTRVEIFAGHAAGGGEPANPVSACTVLEFWNDNPELDYGAICRLLDDVGRPGGVHLVGGGAAAAFTIRKARH